MPARAPAATLGSFYEGVIRPILQRKRVSKTHLELHAFAVARFETFCGADMPLAAIDERLLERFEAYLWEVAPSQNRFRNVMGALRSILNFRQPENTPSKRVRPVLPPPPKGSLREFFERVYLPHRLIGRAESTADCYRGSLYHLLEHYGRDVLLGELTDDLVAEHLRWVKERGRSNATLNRVLAQLLTVWRYAHSLGACEAMPRLKRLPQDNAAPDAWSRKEMERIFASCHVMAGRLIRGIPADLWWCALLRVGYYTALRRRALFGLQWCDVSIEEATITAPAKIMKTRQGQKFVLGSDAIRALLAIETPRRELLFPMDGDCFKRVYRQFDAILTAAKVKGSLSNTPYFHKLRRSTATLIADKKGVNAAAELLGHRAPYITRRYIDLTQMKGHDFTDVLAPLPE